MNLPLHPSHRALAFLLQTRAAAASFAATMLFAACVAAPASERSPPKLPLRLEGLSEDDAREAREVYRVTRERFTEITGRPVGALKIRVQLVERAMGGEASRTLTQVMGVTRQSREECRISITPLRRGSFGRVLAHELTHAFLHEAYGRTTNRALNEGLAEYLASLSYSAEVNRDQRAAAANYASAQKLQPYVAGYNFCLHYARDPDFIAFFDRRIYMPDFGFDDLMTAWRREKLAAKK